MIFDGPKSYPNSCVLYTRFRHHEPRQLFAYLRDLESLLQEEIGSLGTEEELRQVMSLLQQADEHRPARLLRKSIELLTVQRMLIWIAHNVTGSEEERALRRRGFGSEEHVRMGKKAFHWTRETWLKLLKGIQGA